MIALVRPLRLVGQALSTNDSPRQIALGFSLGMVIGLVPKGNLLAVALGIALCALAVNKTAGLFAAGVFSAVGPLADGFAHQLGSLVLTWPAARGCFVWLYELPLGPWIGWNNTVVVGQLLLGLYLAYPAYWLAARGTEVARPPLVSWFVRLRLVRILRGAELGVKLGS